MTLPQFAGHEDFMTRNLSVTQKSLRRTNGKSITEMTGNFGIDCSMLVSKMEESRKNTKTRHFLV